MDKRLLEIFLKLVTIDGTSANERNIADFIISFLTELKLSPYEDSCAKASNGNSGNILCPIGDGGDFILLSHMDTARPTINLKPIIHSDRITSDGTTILGADNRAGIACLLYSLEKLITQKIPVRNFTLVFTIQEETTLNGSRFLELNGRYKMGFVFDSHTEPGNFICESAGSIGFTEKIYGKAAHSGLAPEQGIDAIKIAALAISNIKLGKIDNETTANIGLIKGGEATNVVPDYTFIEGEVRSMNPSKLESKVNEIRAEFESVAHSLGGKSEFNSYWNFKPYKVPRESDTYSYIEKAITKAGLVPRPIVSKGGSDANSINAKGIPCVNLGIGAENPHSNDEYILFESLESTSRIAMELMKK